MMLLLLSCALALAATTQADGSPYPRSAKPPTTLRVYATGGMAPGDQVTLETLGGGLAREQPELYNVATTVESDSAYSLWLSEMRKHFGVKVDASMLTEPMKLLGSYKSQITGYVKHSMTDNSTNAALTFIAGQKPSELLIAVSTPTALTLMKQMGVPTALDCTGMTSLDTYKLRGAAAFSGNMISFQPEYQWSNLAEYAVFAGAPTIEWACTHTPPNAPKNWGDLCTKDFPGGGEAAELAVSDFNKASRGLKVALGWGPESAYVAALGEKGFYVHASDDSHDMTPMANVVAHATARRARPLRLPAAPVQTPPAATAAGKHKIAFLMSDGDNIQWMYNAFPIQKQWWGSPDRGTVPIGWTISPGLVELGPVIVDFLARTATPKDDFIAAPSGVGYAYPSVWADDQLKAFGKMTGEYMAKTSTALGGAGKMKVVNTIGDPCTGGVFYPGCPGLQQPNMSAVAPVLDHDRESRNRFGIFSQHIWNFLSELFRTIC